MDNPLTPFGAPDESPPLIAQTETAAWSGRARTLLAICVLIATAMAVYGISLALNTSARFDLAEIFTPALGVTLTALGLLLGLKAWSLLTSSGPQAPFRYGDAGQARALFVVVWLVGSVLAMTLTLNSIVRLRLELAIATLVGLCVAGAGALWLARWIGARFDGEWPVDETSDHIRQRPRAWSVFFAFVWGIFSTVLAIFLEILLIQLALPYIQSRMPAGAALETVIVDLLRDPVIVVGLIVGFVAAAPIVEEVSKALGLRLFRGSIHSHGDGLMLGLAAGLGFGCIESAGYILGGTGSASILFLAWLRVLTMLMHSLTTGLAGAGYARARLSGERRALTGGLRRAIVLHGLWNAGAGLVLFLGTFSLLVFLAVFVVLLVAAARLLPRIVTAAVDKSIQDDYALGSAVLPGVWSPIEEGVWWRATGGRPMYPRPDAPLDVT